MLEADELVKRKENSIKVSESFSLKSESSRSVLKRDKETLVKE
jgi:hypothetical protein